MDENTPVLVLVVVATTFMYSVVGSELIESATGRRMPLLERLGVRQRPRVPVWWAGLWLTVILALTGVLLIVMVAAALGPERAPLTRVVGALGIAMFVAWLIEMVRVLRLPIR